MLDFFRKQAEKARSTSKAKTDVSPKYPPAWPLCSDDHPKPRINPQTQSPLFTVLSAELRIQVYQAVLTDPPRFLHIIKNRFPARHGLQKLKKKVPERRVAHYWCTDMESPYPTWQHVCYGESLDPTSPIPRTFHRRPITETNDKLLSLLQTCRQVYSETLPILYQENIFHFRGSPSLIAFAQSPTSGPEWYSIRHIHLSTLFTESSIYERGMYFWPPESISRWRWVASLLAHIKRLDVLKLDIMCSVPLEHSDYQTTTDEIVLGALKPLKDLKAKVFTVEINVQPSVKVWTRLEEVNFTLEVTERPFKTEVYGRNPRLEHTDRENWVR